MITSPPAEDLSKLKSLVDYAVDDLPVWTAQGDWVCILLGGPVPYVLRPRERILHSPSNTMREFADCDFIGECYTPGFMHGQAVNLNTRKDFNYIDLVLH